MFHLTTIVFQSCKFKGNMSPKKASMEREMKNLEECRYLEKWLKAGRVTTEAELKQRDVSQIPKLRENMSPTKEVMVHNMKGVTKKTRLVLSVGKASQD